MRRLTLALVILLITGPAFAQLKIHKVSDAVYALVGSLGNRDFANLGNNATFGVILTKAGVVLVDPGGTYKGAAQIDRAIDKITDAPVVVVINSGGQDHRWLGNSYWAEQGARIIASEAAIEDHKDRESMQFTVLEALVGGINLAGTTAHYASETFTGTLSLTIGETELSLHHTGGAHTPGDCFVWLPGESTVFTGDIVYTERMLGVTPVSNTRDWLAAFEAIDALHPEHVIPGHGKPTDILDASAATYDYLVHLRGQIGQHIEDGGTIMDAPKIDQSDFAHLQNFDLLSGRNAQAVFEEMEWE